jgi:glutaminyl-tRNA synthetase
VKATLHWVAAKQAIAAEARLFDHLFVKPNPDEVEEGQDYSSNLNPDSLEVVTCYVEPSVLGAKPGTRYQFERQGYFCVDTDSTPEKLCFNRTVTLRNSWAKIEKAMNGGGK